MPKALLIIAQRGYQDVELDGVQKELRSAGYDIVIASKEAGECTGKYGGKVQATVAMRDALIEDCNRVAFIGGPGAEALRDDRDAQELARAVVEAGKPLGAICIAPLILASAGLLRGKKATVWDSKGEQARFLAAKGATFTGELVTIDGSILTGNGPGAAHEFGRAFATL